MWDLATEECMDSLPLCDDWISDLCYVSGHTGFLRGKEHSRPIQTSVRDREGSSNSIDDCSNSPPRSNDNHIANRERYARRDYENDRFPAPWCAG
jgi:hypothetical protein